MMRLFGTQVHAGRGRARHFGVFFGAVLKAKLIPYILGSGSCE